MLLILQNNFTNIYESAMYYLYLNMLSFDKIHMIVEYLKKSKNSKFLCYLEIMKIDIQTNKSIKWQCLKIRKLKLCIWKIDLNNEYCKQWRWSREMVKLWIIYNCIIPKNIICHENIFDCYKKKISYRNYFIVEDLIISPFRYIDWIGSTNC